MSPTKDAIVAGVIKVAFIGSALWFFSEMSKHTAETFHASGSSSKVMSEKAAINALTTAKGKFMTVTFLKKDGSTRRMRCRTGVKRYVKGVGSPLGTPSNRLQKYKLITVYDLDKAGYRSIPVDRVLSVKAAGKTFSSKNPKGKQMSAEEYNSYNAEWEAIFETFGRRGYFADLSDDETEGMSDNEIMELVLDEGDLGWEEDPELIPDVLEKHAEGEDEEPMTSKEKKEMIKALHKIKKVLPKKQPKLDAKLEAHLKEVAKKMHKELFDSESYVLCNCGDAAKWQWQIIESLYQIDDDPIVSEIVVAEHFRDSDEYCTGCFEKEYGWNPELSSLVGMNPPCGECGGPTTEEIDSAVDGTYVYQCANLDYDKTAVGCEWNSWPPHQEHREDHRGDDFELSLILANMERELGIDSEDYEDFTTYPNPIHRLGAAIAQIEQEFGVKEEDFYAESFEAPYGGSGALMDIGKDTALGSFSPSELATSSAIHGDFDQASLNYSGAQNLVVRAESDRDEDEEDYEQYLRLQGLCECTACGDVSALSTGTTDKQGLYRCIACVTAKQPSISEEEIVEDMDYLRGTY